MRFLLAVLWFQYFFRVVKPACPSSSYFSGSGTLNMTGQFAAGDVCRFIFTEPASSDSMLFINLTYIFTIGQCGPAVDSRLRMPDETPECGLPTDAPKCFLYVKNSKPSTCEQYVTDLSQCSPRTVSIDGHWPPFITYFNGDVSLPTLGFRLNYNFINCADPTATKKISTPSITSYASTLSSNITAITGATADSVIIPLAAGGGLILIIIIVTIIVLVLKKRKQDLAANTDTQDRGTDRLKNNYTTMDEPRKMSSNSVKPIQPHVVAEEGYDTLHASHPVAAVNYGAIDTDREMVPEALNDVINELAIEESHVYDKLSNSKEKLQEDDSYATLDHMDGPTTSADDTAVEYATVDKPSRMRSISVIDPLTKVESVYADMSGSPRVEVEDPVYEFDSDEFDNDNSDQEEEEPPIYSIVEKKK